MFKNYLKQFLPKSLKIVYTILFIIAIFLIWSIVQEIILGKTPILGNHNDFLAFYSASYFSLHGHLLGIYNPMSVANFQHHILNKYAGAAGYMPFLNPPIYAVLLSPLALFAEPSARTIWLVFNFLLASLVIFIIVKEIEGKKKILTFILLLGTFPMYQALVEGQPSIIILLGTLLSLNLAKNNIFGKSSFLLVLWLKPQLAIFTVIGLFFLRTWRILLGFTLLSLGILFISLPVISLHSYIYYGQYLENVLFSHFNQAGKISPAPWKGSLNLMSNMLGFFSGILGQKDTILVDFLTVVSSAILVGIYVFITKNVRIISKNWKELLLISSIITALLIDPHLYSQDGVLIYLTIKPLIKIFKNPIIVIGVVSFICDLVLVDQFSPFHFFTFTILVTLLFIFWKTVRRDQLKMSGAVT